MSTKIDFTIRIVVCITLLCMYLLLWGPLVINAACKFAKNSDKMIITQRNPTFTLLHSTVSIIAITIYCPSYLLYTADFNTTLTKYMEYASFGLYPFLAYAFIWGIAMKYWLLCFKINWLKSTQNAAWKIHINQSQAVHNWFLTHKQTLGSTSYVLRVVLFLWLLSQASYWFVIVYFGPLSMVHSFVQTIIIFIPIIIIMIMWKMTPSVYDHLFYLQECRIIITFGGVYVLVYLLVGLSPMVGATPYVRQTLGNVVGCTGYFFVGIFQLQFSLSKLKKSADNTLLKAVVSYVENAPESPSASTANIAQNESVWNIMRDIMNDADKLSAFFDHLAHEFSIECGLAYIEFVQYKQLIDEELFPNRKRVNTPNETVVLSNIEIPNSFLVYADMDKIEYYARRTSKVQSDVPNLAQQGGGTVTEFGAPIAMEKIDSECEHENENENEMNLHEYQMRAYLLYKKYIDARSHLQINISYKQRQRLATILTNRTNRINIDAEVLLTLWDSVLRELWQLMTHSCGRFINTSAYNALSGHVDD